MERDKGTYTTHSVNARSGRNPVDEIRVCKNACM